MALLVIKSVSKGTLVTLSLFDEPPTPYEAPEPIAHADVAVWGGPSRLAYHGIAPLADGDRPRLGRQRINLTFRRAA